MLARAQLTIRDERDWEVSATPPATPVLDTLWMDTSVTPHTMKRWNGNAWVPVGADLQNYYTKTELETRFEQTDQAIALKANETTVTSLSTRVSAAEQKITPTAIVSTVRTNAQYQYDLYHGRNYVLQSHGVHMFVDNLYRYASGATTTYTGYTLSVSDDLFAHSGNAAQIRMSFDIKRTNLASTHASSYYTGVWVYYRYLGEDGVTVYTTGRGWYLRTTDADFASTDSDWVHVEKGPLNLTSYAPLSIAYFQYGSTLAGVTGTVQFRNVKLEVGNEFTGWSAAPEDLGGLPGRMTTAETSITQNANSIALKVNTSTYNAEKVYRGTVAPTSPTTNMLWLDTSVSPNLLKRYTGSAWVAMGAEELKTSGIYIGPGNVTITTEQFLLQLLDPANNENVLMEMSADGRVGFKDLYADNIVSDSLAVAYSGPATLYVNPAYASGGTQYFPSLGEAVKVINNRYLKNNVTIYLPSSVTDVYEVAGVHLRGITGPGQLMIYGYSTSTLNTYVTIIGCQAYILFQNVRLRESRTLIGGVNRMVGVSSVGDAPSGTAGTAPILTASPLNLAPSVFTTGKNGACTQRAANEGVIFSVTGAYGGMQLSIRQSLEAGKTYTASVDILSTTGSGANAFSLRAYNLTKSMYMTNDVTIPSGWDGSRRRVSITFQTSESRYTAGDNVILWLICGGTFVEPAFEFLVADTVMVSDAGHTQYIPPAEKIQLTLPELHASTDGKWRDEYADGTIRCFVDAQGNAQLPQYGMAEHRIPLDLRYAYQIEGYAPDMRALFSIPRKVVLSGLDEANARLDASDASITELREQAEGLAEFDSKLGTVLGNSFLVTDHVDEKMDLLPLINAYWGHTTSTFSGWGGAIGPAQNFNAVVFKIRNRSGNELPVTAIRVVVKVFDKTGATLADVTGTDFHIQPGEESEILFDLGMTIANAEGNQLWAGYWCNQLIDEWYGSTGINLNPPAYGKTTYVTNGSLTVNGTDVHDPTSANTGKPFLYAARVSRVYQPKEGFIAALPKPEPTPYYAPVRVILPKRFDCVVGDTFQLFYRGVVEAVNPYQYDIRIKYTGQNGRNYPRYFQLIPQATDIGEHTLTITVQSDDDVVLGTATTAIHVNAVPAVSPASPVNVLCIGDSLTAGGVWVKEMARRLLETGGAPAGHGLTNISFIGTVGSASVKWEGYGGWSWRSYLSANGNPFWNITTEQVDFANYCQVNGFAGIDHVFTLLTWNGLGPYRATAADHSALIASAKQLIDKIHAQYPAAKIHVMGIQIPSLNGGMGENYGAGGGAYSEVYGSVRTVFGLNLAYQALADEAAYSGFVDFVNISGQFDSENNMPESTAPVNTRSAKTETRGTNGVHPSEAGYWQIADAAYRRFVSLV